MFRFCWWLLVWAPKSPWKTLHNADLWLTRKERKERKEKQSHVQIDQIDPELLVCKDEFVNLCALTRLTPLICFWDEALHAPVNYLKPSYQTEKDLDQLTHLQASCSALSARDFFSLVKRQVICLFFPSSSIFRLNVRHARHAEDLCLVL